MNNSVLEKLGTKMLRFITLVLFASSAASANVCQKGAHFVESACNKNCSDLHFGHTCPEVATPGCECGDGYFLTNSGTCVHMYRCPEKEVHCPSNQVFSNCHSCEKTCQALYQHTFCLKDCQQGGCICAAGYLRNQAGDCVKPQDCKSEEIVCPTGLKVKCGNGNVSTCENFSSQEPETQDGCIQTCACAEVDAVYDPATKRCVLKTECEELLARRDCGKPFCKPVECPNKSFICYEECETECSCKKGYQMDTSSQKCI